MALGARFQRPMTLGVRGLVLDDQNRVLLVRHTYVSGFYLPGGGVESGETLMDALERELHEEANVLLDEPPELFGLYFNRRFSARDHVALYLVRSFRLTQPHVPDREIAEAGFFTLDALPADTTPATRARISEALEKAPISPYW
ncbi:NUDIX domain-containing protein [Methylocystis sp. B8]|uniref:NUDIX domain-containing protein n=1 Tax=Methylocystis sp. B8 TaxID=544938 RepID=UPI001FEE26CA|nr:NUDIX domain-containing protein [Methylocystis sp. B8]